MVKTRALGKQELTGVINNLEWCLKHLKKFLEFGYGDRKEFSEPVSIIANALIEIEEAVKRLDDTV